MGNQLLKNNKHSKDYKDGHGHQKKHHKKNGDFRVFRDKRQSSADFGGAVPYKETNYNIKEVQEPGRGIEEKAKPKVEIKIYRSYGDLDRYRQELVKDQSNPDIRIYRRSNNSIAAMSSTTSLPKDFGGKNLTKQQKKQLLNGELAGGPSHGDRLNVEEFPDGPVSCDQKLSPQHRSAPNIAVRKSMASHFHFPGAKEIKRKLQVFEDSFQKSLTYKFLTLEENRLLDTIALARDLQSSAEISVRHYLLGRDISMNLPRSHFVLLIPLSLFKLLQNVRQDCINDRKLWRSLARDIVSSVGVEVGKELGRMYEYQIVMLQEDVSIQLLASHAADCVLEFVTRKRALLHRNSALRGVVSTTPSGCSHIATVVSVIIGKKECKWDLFDILKMPGIRKDIYYKDMGGSSYGAESPFPWRFFAHETDCKPTIYGYRGQMLELDFINEVYRLHPEEKLYTQEEGFDAKNYHMQYVPFKALVGSEIMREYLDHVLSNELPDRPNVSLSDFYKHMVPFDGDCRQQEMVYRPLSKLGHNFTWKGAVLENTDLMRVDLKNNSGECQSLRGSVLLQANFRDTNAQATDMRGCDLSYAIIGGSTKLPSNGHATDTSKGNKVKFLLLEDQLDDQKNRQDLIIDEEGKALSPFEVLQSKMNSSNNVTPEKNVPSFMKNNLSGTSSKGDKGQQGEKRRMSSTDTINRAQRQKHRRLQNHGHGYMSKPNHDKYKSSIKHDITASPSLSESSDGLERGEIAYADAVPSFDELKAKRAVAPVLNFPPPPTYSPDMNSHINTSVSSAHPTSIESQIEAFMTSPRNDYPQNQQQFLQRSHNQRHSGPSPQNVQKTTSKPFKAPVPKKACLQKIEDSPGAILMEKIFMDLCELYGREEETCDISDAIIMNTRLVTITGCPGLGKSSVAIASARQLQQIYDMQPIFVNLRGCLTSDQVRAKIVQSLGLRLTRRHFELIGNWLGSHNRKILLLLDNLDLPVSELDGFADLLPNILTTDKVYLLCTSRKAIFGGDFGVTDYKLGDIEEASADLLRNMVPDLPDSCVQELASVCGYVPYTICLVGSALKHPQVSAQKLYQNLVIQTHVSVNLNSTVREMLNNLCSIEDQPLVYRLYSVVHIVLGEMPAEIRKLLQGLSPFQGPFDKTAAQEVLTDRELQLRLPDFPYNTCTCYGGLLNKDPTGQLLIVPHLVQAVLQTQGPRGPNRSSQSAEFKYFTFYISKILHLCKLYHSKNHFLALEGMWRDYLNIIDALKKAMYENRELYESCSSLASPEMCTFLYEALEESDYLDLYQCLMDVTKQWVDTNVDRQVLCCFAYFHLRGENFSEASSLVDEAMKLFPKASPNLNQEKLETFAILLLMYRGVLDWKADVDEEDEEALHLREISIEKIKNSVELLKQNLGLQDPLTIYGFETYALIEKERGQYQKARHYYNILDFLGGSVFGAHPALLDGFDARRAIWERTGLFCRASSVAQMAAEVARDYHGEHPFTAELFMKWVDCLIKVGDISEATYAADVALMIRKRLYGDHIETVLSQKMVAYLYLRCGLYEEATNHALQALEISSRLRVHSAYLTDIETILSQAQKRKGLLDRSTESKDSNANIKKYTGDCYYGGPTFSTTSHQARQWNSQSTGSCKREADLPYSGVRACLSTAV